MPAKIVQEKITHDDTTFYAVRLETKNANLLLLSEGEAPIEKMLGPPVSSILLGDRNTIIARMIAERLARKTGKIGIASVFTKLREKDTGTVFLRLFDKAFGEEKEVKEK